jgi:hypothetical protein
MDCCPNQRKVEHVAIEDDVSELRASVRRAHERIDDEVKERQSAINTAAEGVKEHAKGNYTTAIEQQRRELDLADSEIKRRLEKLESQFEGKDSVMTRLALLEQNAMLTRQNLEFLVERARRQDSNRPPPQAPSPMPVIATTEQGPVSLPRSPRGALETIRLILATQGGQRLLTAIAFAVMAAFGGGFIANKWMAVPAQPAPAASPKPARNSAERQRDWRNKLEHDRYRQNQPPEAAP